MKKITIVIPASEKAEILDLNNLNKQKIPLIIEKGPNPSKNRNQGVKKVKTPYVAFINTHTLLSSNWLKEINSFISKYKSIDIVGGPQLNNKDEGFFAKSSGFALSSIFGAATVSSRYKTGKIDFDANEFQLTSANLICKKEVFKKVKFDESLYPGEDPKFIADAKSAGFNVAYSPDIVVYNKRRTNLLSLSKQIFNYGKTRTMREGLSAIKNPAFAVPSLFLLYLITLPFTLALSSLFIYPIYLYILLNLIFSIYESSKNNILFSFFVLPFIFLTIHLSYGAGFIYGLFLR